jgi:hypothetical protein
MSSLNDLQENLISNVTIEPSSSNTKYVSIRFTIALAVPAGKFYLKKTIYN